MKLQGLGEYKEFAKVTLLQVYFTYIQAIPLITIGALAIGSVIAFQAQLGLTFFSRLENIGLILNTILFREVTPLFITILIVIRSITAITSELATMKVNREIDALNKMGISIDKFLIRPRVFAGSISFFCMSLTFFIMAFLGHWFFLNIESNITLASLIHFFSTTVEPIHLIFFVLKTFLIGGFIVHRACYYGLRTERATFEIPIVTNKSVVECLILGVGLQIALTSLSYMMTGLGALF